MPLWLFPRSQRSITADMVTEGSTGMEIYDISMITISRAGAKAGGSTVCMKGDMVVVGCSANIVLIPGSRVPVP